MEIQVLREKAQKLKENGLSEYEIASELNVAEETVAWLLSKKEKEKPLKDVKIGWRSIGVYPTRIAYISSALSDVIIEEADKRDLQVDTVVGVAINGIPYATFIAEELDLELAIFRPHVEKVGLFSSNYASVRNKNVVIIDDVVGSGKTMRRAITVTKKEGGNPVLCVALVNKRSQNDIDGVPLRALVRTRAI
ncbi:MAG: orotate phosphoribosyltransferase-like protein [Thermoplasmata archaeon]|nr:orotate phosphoribosyltransferase-like protein [Thermoplasmata archaeon]RLF27619.1 MAG: orotate phosphoribosyltransferase-like protein [Thermoplasmata archaeon]